MHFPANAIFALYTCYNMHVSEPSIPYRPHVSDTTCMYQNQAFLTFHMCLIQHASTRTKHSLPSTCVWYNMHVSEPSIPYLPHVSVHCAVLVLDLLSGPSLQCAHVHHPAHGDSNGQRLHTTQKYCSALLTLASVSTGTAFGDRNSGHSLHMAVFLFGPSVQAFPAVCTYVQHNACWQKQWSRLALCSIIVVPIFPSILCFANVGWRTTPHFLLCPKHKKLVTDMFADYIYAVTTMFIIPGTRISHVYYNSGWPDGYFLYILKISLIYHNMTVSIIIYIYLQFVLPYCWVFFTVHVLSFIICARKEKYKHCFGFDCYFHINITKM